MSENPDKVVVYLPTSKLIDCVRKKCANKVLKMDYNRTEMKKAYKNMRTRKFFGSDKNQRKMFKLEGLMPIAREL